MYTNGTTHIDMHEFIFISQLRHRKSFILPLSFDYSFLSLYIENKNKIKSHHKKGERKEQMGLRIRPM